MKVDDIRKVLIVGTGTMGQKIALQCARFGYDVVAYDAFPKSLENAKARIPGFAAELVEKGKMTPEASAAALSRIRYTSDPKDGADADLLNESVLEDPELKGKVFAQFNAICKPETIFTTNTSTLLPSLYAEATGRPARFAACTSTACSTTSSRTSWRTPERPRRSWRSWRPSPGGSSRCRWSSRGSIPATSRTPCGTP